MMTISLSDDVLRSLPQAVKDALLIEIQRRLQGNTPGETAVMPPAAPEIEEVNDGAGEQPADLSVAQATRFLEGCSDKTTKVIRAIVEGGTRDFRISAIEKALNMSTDDLAGVWGGLTKRTRTILGDRKAKLFAWPRNFYDANGDWTDTTGELSQMTYGSFRQALGL
jgi:hypothetical protein